jgi:D-alanine-D-alanine ligase
MKLALLYTKSKLTPWKENVNVETLRFIQSNMPEYVSSEIIHFNGFSEEMKDKLSQFDLIFNLSYGYRDAGQVEVASWLEAHNFRVTTASSGALSIAQDKNLLPQICTPLGINTPDIFGEIADLENDNFYIAKPFNGSCHRNIIIESGLWFKSNRNGQDNHVIQPYIVGREFSVAIVPANGIGDYFALPPVEILPKSGAKVFIAGQEYGETYKDFDPELSLHIRAALMQQALSLHEVIGLRGMSRTDFKVDENGEIYVLDVNAMPNLHPQKSVMPALCKHHHYPINTLIERIISMSFLSSAAVVQSVSKNQKRVILN